MSRKIQVLVVDDQLRARTGLKALLATCPVISQIREAVNGREALQRVEECRPDVVLMDIVMPELNGLEATRQIKARWQPVKVIVLSMYGEYASEAVAAGADSFICKCEPPETLLRTLIRIAGVLESPPDTYRDSAPC